MLQRVARLHTLPARRAGPAITPTVQPLLLRPEGLVLGGLGAALLCACVGFAAGLMVAGRRRR